MKELFAVFRLMVARQRGAMLAGALLALVVLLMGVALLGLSGWFITASALAGLAGVGATFNVFVPSALVRFLALGRTAARYGERLATHDATLRTLAALRVRLLAQLAAAPWEALIRLRGATALNRLMADVDALDGIPLRLILPIGAGLAAQLATFAALWVLVDWRVAAAVLAVYLMGSVEVFGAALRASRGPSARVEALGQRYRAGVIEVLRARADLLVHGRIGAESAALSETDKRRRGLATMLDRIGRDAGAALSVTATLAVAAALWIGLVLAEAGSLTPALAALGVFAALGLGETVAPMHRAAIEVGRMRLAARRMAETLTAPEPMAETRPAPVPHLGAPVLRLEGLGFRRPGAAAALFADVELSLAPGETLALTGASGSGKSTLLALAAGLIAPDSGRVALLGHDLAAWSEPALRGAVTLVSQRASLVAGDVRDNLALAAPDADDATLAAALEAVRLSEVLAPRGGLDARLGPGGAGLSGGQARRLVLARALLRRPALLLLDEPTEGLDRPTAEAVLAGLRAALPAAAILVAAHRVAEISWADRTLSLDSLT